MAEPVPNINELSEGSVNLLRQLPYSQRWIYRRLAPYAFWVVASGLVYGVLRYEFTTRFGGTAIRDVLPIFFYLFVGTVAYLGYKFLYFKIASKLYRCGIEGEHLVFSRGILFKERAAYPLSRITDVFIDRSFLDVLFGLYNLQISTPTSASSQIARVAGLTKVQAIKLQEILLSYLDRSHYVPRGDSELVAARSRGRLVA